MDNICELVEQLEELLSIIEEFNGDDALHIALDIGYQFRDELNAHCEE